VGRLSGAAEQTPDGPWGIDGLMSEGVVAFATVSTSK